MTLYMDIWLIGYIYSYIVIILWWKYLIIGHGKIIECRVFHIYEFEWLHSYSTCSYASYTNADQFLNKDLLYMLLANIK